MTVAEFEQSAAAAAAPLARASTVGRRIRASVEATIYAVGHNTNLGIILLSAPLAEAASRSGSGNFRQTVIEVLQVLTVDDARETYAAIRHARPGGLGHVEQLDVQSEPRVNLLEAMQAAENRDRIAWNYTHGFADIFDLGLPALAAATAQGQSLSEATTSVYLTFLAAIPDTLIARKYGAKAAEHVQGEALALRERVAEAPGLNAFVSDLLAFDASLKARGLNPGTSADLTVATLFAAILSALEMSS